MASSYSLAVPGAGSMADVLARIKKLSDDMNETKRACSRLHGRLEVVFTTLQNMELDDSQDICERTVDVVSKYLQFLTRYHGKDLVHRVVEHSTMMDQLRHFHEEVAVVFELLSIFLTSNWGAEWEDDHHLQMEVLTATVKSCAVIRSELQDPRDRAEALLLLKFEVEQRGERNDDDVLGLMKSMLATVLVTSNTAEEALPTWFLPLEFEPKPFARRSIGTVHRGVWGDQTDVAIKFFLVDDEMLDERMQRLLEKELDAITALSHPNVVKMFGASHISLPPFTVYEFASNGSLSGFLARSDRNKQQMWRLLYEAALGLSHIHERNIVHGNLKLSNILESCSRIVDAKGVTPLVSILQSGTTAQRDGAVRALANLAQNSASRGQIVRKTTLSLLVVRLRSGTDTQKYHASRALSNLAIDKENCGSIVHAGAITPFVILLQTGNDNQSVSAARAVANLSAATEYRRLLASAIPPLVSLLQRGTDVEKDEASRALASLAGDEHNRPLIIQEGALPIFVTLLGRGNSCQKDQTSQALANLALDACHAASIAREGAIPALVELLSRGGGRVHAVRALGNLTLDGETRKIVASAGVIQPLLGLVRAGTMDEKTLATWILVNLSVDPPNRDPIARAGFIPLLVELLTTGVGLVNKYSAHAIRHLACSPAIRGVQPIKQLVALLRDGTDGEKGEAALALGTLAINQPGHRAKIAKLGAVALLDELRRTGGQQLKRNAEDALGRLNEPSSKRLRRG